jgi:uncharacterized protein YndB with AHSA1/START domain
MEHPFEITQTIDVDVTAEEAWDAIATGPGQDSWFMGRNTVEPREGGTSTFSVGDFTQTSTITAWQPPTRFAFSSDQGAVGMFHRFDYQISERPEGGVSIRYEHGGMLGDDWEAEYEAMQEGDPAYVFKLHQYLTYFRGRYATSVEVYGPEVGDRERAMAVYRRALGLGDDVALDAPVKAELEGVGTIDGVVDFLSPSFLGVRTPDAILRFIWTFDGHAYLGHHLFADGVDRGEAERAWGDWLRRTFGSG